jgi:DNA-binding NarL/FixJ family response regulator
MTKVLIVDDQEDMRRSLTAAFGESPAFQVVGAISSAEFAPLCCERFAPGLVVMDICTEGGASGLLAARRIKAVRPETKIIIMTGSDEVLHLLRAKEAGAEAFVFKSRGFRYFVETAEHVINGGFCYPESKKIPSPAGEPPLTAAELELLCLLCRHLSDGEIAAALSTDQAEVERRKAHMLEKTGFQTSVELAFYMISNGWINSDS